MIPQRNISLIANALAKDSGKRIPEAVIERDYVLAWFLEFASCQEGVLLVLVRLFHFLLIFGMSIPILNPATRCSLLKANFSMETSRTTSLRPALDYHISAGFYFIP